jgi:ubiquinone/menaquinone biosynthesis C-methylase UbiE
VIDAGEVARIFNARADRYVHDDWHRRYAEALVNVTPLRPGDRVLDAATGTGFAARAIARRVGPTGHVVAVDLSRRMLEHARAICDTAALANVECLQADVTTLRELGTSTFDAVVCAAGLLYMPAEQALAAWHRLLKNDGIVAFSTMQAGSPSAGRLFRECAAAFGLQLVDPSEALGTEARCRRALEAAGFDDAHVIAARVDFERLDPTLAWEANSRAFGGAVRTLSTADQRRLEQQFLNALAQAMEGDLAASSRADVLFATGRRSSN